MMAEVADLQAAARRDPAQRKGTGALIDQHVEGCLEDQVDGFGASRIDAGAGLDRPGIAVSPHRRHARPLARAQFGVQCCAGLGAGLLTKA